MTHEENSNFQKKSFIVRVHRFYSRNFCRMCVLQKGGPVNAYLPEK